MNLLAEQKKKETVLATRNKALCHWLSIWLLSSSSYTHNNVVVMLMCCDHNSLMEKKKDLYSLTFPCQVQ